MIDDEYFPFATGGRSEPMSCPLSTGLAPPSCVQYAWYCYAQEREFFECIVPDLSRALHVLWREAFTKAIT